ncbi:galactose oxidase [uncultured Polaribacter sp.]|uniref:Kelch repeat-containing protein n=1 Tax=uncultured Polaribacter sp. TaxID=174711 RepID=UPI0026060498|nr:galactose oxidase [uncultured Polaribacter sp.]
MKFTIFFTLFVMLFSSCKKSKDTIKTWQFVSGSNNSKPIERHEAAFVSVKDKFYLLGGRKIKPVSIYNTQTKEWTIGAKPPVEMHHFQPVVYNNEVYVIGAFTGKYPLETPIEAIYVYNPELDAWRIEGKIPKERLRGATGNCIVGDIVYISCGIKNGHTSDHKNWLDAYNLKTKTWSILPDAPRSRDHFQAVENNGNIYLLGGRLSKAPKNTFSETIAEVDVYNIKLQEWLTLNTTIPTERAGAMSVLYEDYILVIGGESSRQKTAHNDVEGLHTKSLEWKIFPSLKQGRHGSGAILFDNSIYVASGSGQIGGKPELKTMERWK